MSLWITLERVFHHFQTIIRTFRWFSFLSRRSRSVMSVIWNPLTPLWSKMKALNALRGAFYPFGPNWMQNGVGIFEIRARKCTYSGAVWPERASRPKSRFNAPNYSSTTWGGCRTCDLHGSLLWSDISEATRECLGFNETLIKISKADNCSSSSQLFPFPFGSSKNSRSYRA